MKWHWVAAIAVAAYWLGKHGGLAGGIEAVAIVGSGLGVGPSGTVTQVTRPQATPTSGVVSAVNPPGTSAWTP